MDTELWKGDKQKPSNLTSSQVYHYQGSKQPTLVRAGALLCVICTVVPWLFSMLAINPTCVHFSALELHLECSSPPFPLPLVIPKYLFFIWNKNPVLSPHFHNSTGQSSGFAAVLKGSLMKKQVLPQVKVGNRFHAPTTFLLSLPAADWIGYPAPKFMYWSSKPTGIWR